MCECHPGREQTRASDGFLEAPKDSFPYHVNYALLRMVPDSPYISLEQRKALDGLIDNLASEANRLGKDETERAGILNYVTTKLTLALIPQDKYWKIALAAGVFSNLASEFYRRIAVPYEDKKVREHGDVF
jgi:hypothetical protein